MKKQMLCINFPAIQLVYGVSIISWTVIVHDVRPIRKQKFAEL